VQTLELKLNLDSLRMSQKGSITGEIWLELGGKSFPEQHWSDFPTAVTAALLGAALHLKDTTDAGREEVWFLDGPYYAVLEQTQALTWLVSLQNLDGFVYVKSSVDGAASFASIRTAAAALVSECAARSWQHPDISVLNDLLNTSV
jgi:hypothetical protein